MNYLVGVFSSLICDVRYTIPIRHTHIHPHTYKICIYSHVHVPYANELYGTVEWLGDENL